MRLLSLLEDERKSGAIWYVLFRQSPKESWNTYEPAGLLEAYAEERGIELEGYGSWTLRRAERERGVEPDECYVLGPRDPAELEVPDIAIEVVWTSGGLEKPKVYTGLGVRELWIWQEGTLTFHVLRGDAYVRVSSSELLPDLDARVIESFMSGASQTQAVRNYRKALQERGTKS